MGDERLRSLERAAAQGDPEAAEALSRARVRHVRQVEFPELLELEERGVDLQAPAELSRAQERLLAEDLAPLGERAGEALRFVTHGHAPEVLDRISPADRAALVIRPRGYYPARAFSVEPVERRLDLLEGLDSPPAFVRLGLIYGAASGSMFIEDDPRPHGPGWLHQMLFAASFRFEDVVSRPPVLSCQRLVEVVDYAQLDSLPLLQLFFDPATGGDWRFTGARLDPDGVVELAERHPDYLSAGLSERHYSGRVGTCSTILELGISIEPFLEELARVAGLGRRAYGQAYRIQDEFRQRYEAGIQRHEIRTALEGALRAGTPEERAELAKFIGEVCGQASRAALERAAARDRAPRVRKAAREALDALTLLSGDPDLDLDPLAPPGAAAEAAFRDVFRDHPDLDRAWELLCEPTPWAPLPAPLLSAELSDAPLNQQLDAFAQLPDVQLGHVCRAVRLTARLEAWEEDWRLRDSLRALDALCRVWFEAHGQPPSLSALGQAWGFLGLDERILGKAALTGDVIERYFAAVNDWSCADYYRRCPETLRDGLGNVASGINEWRSSLLNEITTLAEQLQDQPEGLPEALHAPFVELALAVAKSTRKRAQTILAEEGDWLDEVLIRELKARRAGRACAAARWLGERALSGHGGRLAQAREALGARLREEKREKVRKALEEALEPLQD